MFNITDDYLAAFIDGEGSFTIGKQRHKFYFRVAISNTNREILELIQKCYGGHLREMKVKGKRKRSFSLDWTGQKAIEISKILKDKLFIKKQQAEIMSGILLVGSGNDLSDVHVEQRNLARQIMTGLNN